MTEIGFVIHPGLQIPDDVTEVVGPDGRTLPVFPGDYAVQRLTVTAVREQPAEPEPDVHYYFAELQANYSTACGIGIEEDLSTTSEAGAATCDACRAAVDEEPIESAAESVPDVLDLVRQYGAAAHNDGYFGASARPLFARIEAEVQRLQGIAAVPTDAELDFEVQRLRDENGKVRGLALELAATEQMLKVALDDEARGWSDWGLMQALGVEQLTDVMPAIERLKAAQPDPRILSLPQARAKSGDRVWQHVPCGWPNPWDWEVDQPQDDCQECNKPGPWRPLLVADAPDPSTPVVLSLPQVPEGAVALVFHQEPAKPIRFTRVEGPLGWRMVDDAGAAHYWGLLDLLVHYGPVTVELAPPREPRTWKQLDDAELAEAPPRVRVGNLYFRRMTDKGTYKSESSGGLWSWWSLRGEADVTEVFDDEAGTRA